MAVFWNIIDGIKKKRKKNLKFGRNIKVCALGPKLTSDLRW